MNIEIKRGMFKTINFQDTNVNIDFNAVEVLYAIDENGKKDFIKRIGDDITDGTLELLALPLEDLFYYRKRPFDSTDLIRQAFDNLPEDKRQILLKELNKNFGEKD